MRGVFLMATLSMAFTVATLPAVAQLPENQTPPPVHPPDTDYAAPPLTAPPPIPATRFVMPDLPDDWKTYTSYDGYLLSSAFSFVALLDYNAFIQDSDSKLQVGEQSDQWDTRTVRLMGRGQLKFPHPVSYLISVEVKGQDHVQTGNSKVGFTDVELARLTGVPYYSDGGASYLHLGVGGRYVGGDEGTLRFRGRPESNVTAYYVESGEIAGDHANIVSLESLWGLGPSS